MREKHHPARSARGHVEDCPHCGSYVDVPHETQQPRVAGSEAAAAGAMPGLEKVDRASGLHADCRSKWQLGIEVLAVLCFAYFPSQIRAFVNFFDERPSASSFTELELWRIVHVFEVALPLLVIMSLTRDPWSHFGIVRPRCVVDAIGGSLICFCCCVAYAFAMTLLPPAVLHGPDAYHFAPKTSPEGILEYGLLLIATTASAFSQELVMRGYLLPRFERLFGSTVLAVLVTSILFGGYHIYQGIVPAIGDVAIGLVFAVAFCILHRLWPLCLGHAPLNLSLYLAR